MPADDSSGYHGQTRLNMSVYCGRVNPKFRTHLWWRISNCICILVARRLQGKGAHRPQPNAPNRTSAGLIKGDKHESTGADWRGTRRHEFGGGFGKGRTDQGGAPAEFFSTRSGATGLPLVSGPKIGQGTAHAAPPRAQHGPAGGEPARKMEGLQ